MRALYAAREIGELVEIIRGAVRLYDREELMSIAKSKPIYQAGGTASDRETAWPKC